ncbi:MAG TPA: proteasome subunit alpha [Nitrospirales bacterium]|nr:proteasome subunit alpha [Nitrospirales bacterium]HIO20895.1 proteasome subunit alpha [Nitrospirales bacterium]
MYEEPYRWVEAITNRRQYLQDQLKQGSPIVAITYSDGIVILTVNRGTPKLYEIYDRIALAGMGHPADLEKLRFQMLDLAHVEGFQRSPSDVTGARLVKYGIAPVVKDAFEEIFKAPYISKILIAELGEKQMQDHFVRLDYDGGFEESTTTAVVGATAEVQSHMSTYLKTRHAQLGESLELVFNAALFTWAIGSLYQNREATLQGESTDSAVQDTSPSFEFPDEQAIQEHLQTVCSEMTLECAVLDRTLAGPSKYRPIPLDAVRSMLPATLKDKVR